MKRNHRAERPHDVRGAPSRRTAPENSAHDIIVGNGRNPPFRVCARLPGLLLAPGHRGGRPRHQAARRSGASRDARVPVRQSGAIPGARVFARAAALSAAPRGRQGRRTLRAHLVGRGPRHHRRTPARGRRASSAPKPSCPTATPAPWGCSTARGMDRRFFHRLGASRLDRTICSAAGGAGLTAGAGRALRHRARAVPPLQADPRVGREHSRHQRAPVAVHHGGAAQRREVLHHRSAAQPHRRGRPTSISSSIRAAIPRWRWP